MSDDHHTVEETNSQPQFIGNLAMVLLVLAVLFVLFVVSAAATLGGA